MDFCRTIFHVVQQGDTFYRLAQRYQTTVPEIIRLNPGLNPYNLQVGTRLKVCNGQINNNNAMQQEEIDLNNDMRQAWNNYAFWTAMLINSIIEALPNSEAVKIRLMKNPAEIAAVFEKYYSPAMTNELKQLLEEHIELTGELLGDMKDNEMADTAETENEWYQNADKIARLLGSSNSKYNYEELRRMLRMHLDMLKDMMMANLNGEDTRAVQITDESTEHLMQLADGLTEGLLAQFYQR